MRRILMVCTGNTCRSPMAEVLLRRLAEQRGADVEVRSAGVAAWPGTSMAEHAAGVLRERGMDPGQFQSTEISGQLVQWADLILTMTTQHKRHLLELFPAAVEKTYTLKEYAVADEQTAALFKERESLVAELQLRLALGQAVTDEDRAKLREFDAKLPGTDVDDPIGSSRERYEATADEIEAALRQVLDRLYSDS